MHFTNEEGTFFIDDPEDAAKKVVKEEADRLWEAIAKLKSRLAALEAKLQNQETLPQNKPQTISSQRQIRLTHGRKD